MKKAILLVAAVALLAVLFAGCAGGAGRGSSGPDGPILNAAGNPVSGTATGSARGYSSDVKVTITIANGMITDVVFDLSGETPAFVAGVGMRGPGEMKENNRPEIDVVTGVTLTCDAINLAAKAAVDAIIAASR